VFAGFSAGLIKWAVFSIIPLQNSFVSLEWGKSPP